MAEPKLRPWMRIQLQRDADASCYDSRLLFPVTGSEFVTVGQVNHALRSLLESPKLPNSQKALGAVALQRAIVWVTERAPAGLTGRIGKSFEFERDNPYHGFRFDVENLFGQNLRS